MGADSQEPQLDSSFVNFQGPLLGDEVGNSYRVKNIHIFHHVFASFLSVKNTLLVKFMSVH